MEVKKHQLTLLRPSYAINRKQQRAMHLNMILLTAFSLLISAACFAQNVTLSVNNQPLHVLLKMIKKQTGYTFFADADLIKKANNVTLQLKSVPLADALKACFNNQPFSYSIQGKIITIEPITAADTRAITQSPADRHSTSTQQKAGKIAGYIRNENNDPMPGVTVSVEGSSKGISTAVSGDYVLTLPPGNYTLLISFVGYQSRRITGVEVKEGEVTDLNAVLQKAGNKQLETVVVTSTLRKESIASLYARQKNNRAISDGISADQIRATPDNNAAQVLKRVSGVVVQNDRFVTIRGVSDRYNNVMINGAMLPSTEPNRRNFSFDIVPSSLVDNIVINKSATPDLPGEFSGGLVQISTKDVPATDFLDLTIGSGFNTASYGMQMKDLKRTGGEYFAAKGSDRSWFGTIMKPKEYVKALYNNDKAYMAEAGSRIANRWGYYLYPYMPVQNYQLSGGKTFRFKNSSSLGVTAGATYRNEQLVETGEKNNMANSALPYSERYRFTTSLGGLLNLAYKSKHHKLAFKNLYNKRFSNQVDYDEGYDYDNSRVTRNTSANLLINRIIQHRLEGEHMIGNNVIKIDWYADQNTLLREQPDTRFIKGSMNEGNGVTVRTGNVFNYNFKESVINWGALYASELDETRKNAGVNIAVPFTVAGNAQQLKLGYAYSGRDVAYNGTGFRILGRNDQEWISRSEGLPYEQIATPENFLKQYISYYPAYFKASSTGDGYEGSQRLDAFYLMGDLHPLPQLRISGGVRYEKNLVTIYTRYLQENGTDSVNGMELPAEKNWLPSFNAVYSITPKLNLRASYGKTLARPDFVERSPFIYYDFPEQLYVYGLYSLKTTFVKNYDVRLEYYPSANEIASLSFFYKDFTNPVERFFMLGNPSNAVVYSNLDKAKVRGLEADIRKSLGFINDGRFFKNVYVSGNFSYLKGNIETYEDRLDSATMAMKRVKIQSDRPVQGLAPYVLNLGLQYQSKQGGINITYNRFGRRIVYGGTYDQYVQYELPRDVLDLQLSVWLLQHKLELKFNVADILNQPFIIYSNVTSSGSSVVSSLDKDPKKDGYNPAYDFNNYKVNRGTNYSFALTWKFY